MCIKCWCLNSYDVEDSPEGITDNFYNSMPLFWKCLDLPDEYTHFGHDYSQSIGLFLQNIEFLFGKYSYPRKYGTNIGPYEL